MRMAEARIAGCIVAGGQSLRMGIDKRFAHLGGKPLIAHAVERLTPQVDQLMINANDDDEGFAAFALPVRADPVADLPGPLAGILAGLLWAREIGAGFLVTATADAPFFPHDLVARFSAAGEHHIVCASSGDRLHPVFAMWALSLTDDLSRALREEQLRKVEDFVGRYRTRRVSWPALPYDPFFNINTPDDLAEAQRILAEFQP
jgi:molybdenum cofactor guanylyltransferase